MDVIGANWRKASRSGANGGDCVEVAAGWRKSSRSSAQSGNCVEAAAGYTVAVRDSKNPDGPTLAVGVRQWEKFTSAVRSGRI